MQAVLPTFEYIKVNAQVAPNVALIELNRPKELNALNRQLMTEIADCLQWLDNQDQVRVIVLTGSARAFAAGADIKQMSEATAISMLKLDQFATWDRIRKTKKPIIAAVSGFCLGGGNELAMTCDMIIAAENAQFGQPEIKIGVIPGAGGTQRLTRALGKAKAMELVLTGRFMTAAEAEKAGLITKVVADEAYLREAIRLASQIAELSPLAVQLGKEAVNKSYEAFLTDGLEFERKNFYMLFASADQKEGMAAFIEKRKADFKGE